MLRVEPDSFPSIRDDAIDLALQEVFNILAPGDLRISGNKAALQFAFCG